MVWISLFLLSFNLFAKELPKFLTKHPLESIRFISIDGRFAYLQKRAGVLGLVTGFKSDDFLSDTSQSNFHVKDSRFKRRLTIEVVPDAQKEFNIIKNHRLLVVDWGKTQAKEIGIGIAARLHLEDEWVSYYNTLDRAITIHNVLTQKKYQIKLSPKATSFFVPEVEMVSADTVLYTDTNEKGFTAFIQYNLITQKSSVLYKSSQTGYRIELCQAKGYIGIGEFPYDDIARSSKIMQIPVTGSTNLAGYTTVYSSTDSDLGNMLCRDGAIYFIKTMTHLKRINFKSTDVVRVDLKSTKVETMSEIGAVTQLLSMDDRILIPYRGEYFVLEGSSNLSDDKLKAPTSPAEELPFEI